MASWSQRVSLFLSATSTVGRLKFTPATNHAAGTDHQSFTFQVQDDGGTALDGQDLDPSPNTITVEVVAPDEAPILAPIGDRRVTEFKTLEIAVSFTDPNDDNVSLSVSGLPSGASFDPQTGILIWTPNGGQAGVYTLTFMATEEALRPTRSKSPSPSMMLRSRWSVGTCSITDRSSTDTTPPPTTRMTRPWRPTRRRTRLATA